MRPSVRLVVLLLGACTPVGDLEVRDEPRGEPPAQAAATPDPHPEAPRPSQRPPRSGLVPVWRVGDRWVVLFHAPERWDVIFANPVPMPEFYARDYLVSAIGEDGVHVVVVDRADAEMDHFELLFDLSGRLLGRLNVAESYDGDEMDIEAPSVWHRWPRFPLEEPFGADGDAVTQRAVKTDAGSLEVTLKSTHERGGNPETVTVVTVWEPGRPWWSSLVVRREVGSDGRKRTGLDSEAYVVEWPGREAVTHPPFTKIEKKDPRAGGERP